eukprot:4337034-Pyramimonas_sp.AAC.1
MTFCWSPAGNILSRRRSVGRPRGTLCFALCSAAAPLRRPWRASVAPRSILLASCFPKRSASKLHRAKSWGGKLNIPVEGLNYLPRPQLHRKVLALRRRQLPPLYQLDDCLYHPPRHDCTAQHRQYNITYARVAGRSAVSALSAPCQRPGRLLHVLHLALFFRSVLRSSTIVPDCES